MFTAESCLLSTLELFARINVDGDELRSRITLIFTGVTEEEDDDDGEEASSVVDMEEEVSLDVFSPLVEQIADDGDERF